MVHCGMKRNVPMTNHLLRFRKSRTEQFDWLACVPVDPEVQSDQTT